MKYKFESTRKNLTFLKHNIIFVNGIYETDDKKDADFLKKSPFVTEISNKEEKVDG